MHPNITAIQGVHKKDFTLTVGYPRPRVHSEDLALHFLWTSGCGMANYSLLAYGRHVERPSQACTLHGLVSVQIYISNINLANY